MQSSRTHVHHHKDSPHGSSSYKYGDKAEEKFQRLESAFVTAPELEEVYNAYQDFLDIVSANGFKYQRERLNNWINEYNRSNAPCEGLKKRLRM